MDERYKLLEERYKLLEDKYGLLEERYKLLKDEHKLLEGKYKLLDKKKRNTSEKRRQAANTRWAKARKSVSEPISIPEACNLSGSERNEIPDPSKSISGHVSSMEQRLDSLSRVVAWQQEEEKRAREFELNLYRDKEESSAPTDEEQVYEYMHTYTMGAKFIDARDEARQFMDYYVANGWVMGQAPIRDWRAAARNWINKAIKHLDKRKQREYEDAKTYADTVRGIHEDAERKREFEKIMDKYW